MKTRLGAAIAAFCLSATVAHGQTTPTVPPGPPNPNPNVGPLSPSLEVCYSNANNVACGSGGSIARPGIGAYFIPLTSFVFTPTTDQLRTDVDAARDNILTLRSQDRMLSAGVAMSAAVDFQMPGDAKSNRLGAGISTFNDETAVAVTYSHREGAWDANLGLATSNYQNLAKASVGFSW